jgi:regulatory protein
MAKITAIKKQKRDGRANIYLDGEFSFGIDLETLFKNHLKINQELSQSEINKIKSATGFQSTLNKLLNFATLRPRSYKEISNWFWKKKTPDNYQKKLIKKLEKLELLDDEKFATWWVGQRQTFRPRSKRQLSAELLQKGIDKKIINNILEDSEINEVEIAKNLVEKNKYKWERFDEKKRVQKMSEYLGRKGFSWEIIKKVIASE